MARGPGKGNTNNPNGRPKGTPNKTTLALRTKINEIIESQMDEILPALNKVRKDNPVQYLTILEKLMSYAMPKKRDITSDDKSIAPNINIQEVRTKRKAD